MGDVSRQRHWQPVKTVKSSQVPVCSSRMQISTSSLKLLLENCTDQRNLKDAATTTELRRQVLTHCPSSSRWDYPLDFEGRLHTVNHTSSVVGPARTFGLMKAWLRVLLRMICKIVSDLPGRCHTLLVFLCAYFLFWRRSLSNLQHQSLQLAPPQSWRNRQIKATCAVLCCFFLCKIHPWQWNFQGPQKERFDTLDAENLTSTSCSRSPLHYLGWEHVKDGQFSNPFFNDSCCTVAGCTRRSSQTKEIRFWKRTSFLLEWDAWIHYWYWRYIRCYWMILFKMLIIIDLVHVGSLRKSHQFCWLANCWIDDLGFLASDVWMFWSCFLSILMLFRRKSFFFSPQSDRFRKFSEPTPNLHSMQSKLIHRYSATRNLSPVTLAFVPSRHELLLWAQWWRDHVGRSSFVACSGPRESGAHSRPIGLWLLFSQSESRWAATTWRQSWQFRWTRLNDFGDHRRDRGKFQFVTSRKGDSRLWSGPEGERGAHCH